MPEKWFQARILSYIVVELNCQIFHRFKNRMLLYQWNRHSHIFRTLACIKVFRQQHNNFVFIHSAVIKLIELVDLIAFAIGWQKDLVGRDAFLS